MSVDGFIPTIWSARLLGRLAKAHIFGQPGVINRDYEGEIRNVGDSVRVGSIGAITIKDYTKNSDIDAPEELTDAQTTLVVDQGKYFNFAVDDVDAAQTRPNLMDGAMGEAAFGLRDVADAHLAGLYTDAATAVGSSGSPKTDLGTEGKAYEYLLALGVNLDEQDVPSTGRWVAVPPWFVSLLLLDKRFTASGSPQAESRIANSIVGQAAGFTVLKSNNISVASTTYRIMAGHPIAWSFAEQISKTEAFRPERRFADAVKGLHVYGAKVMRPKALSVLYANRA